MEMELTDLSIKKNHTKRKKLGHFREANTWSINQVTSKNKVNWR